MRHVKQFYTADLHFGHALMLKPDSCARPFSSTAEMDDTICRNWNSVVGPENLVWVLGDFSMGLQDEWRVASLFARLMGRKRLILGNHDYKRPNVVHPTLAGLAWDEPPAPAAETIDEGQRVYMSHYAHRVWPGSHKGSWHFYGHNHGGLPSAGRSRDVGVDCPDTAFTPNTFRQLTANMRNA